MTKHIAAKIEGTAVRAIDAVRLLPRRLWRLFVHFAGGIKGLLGSAKKTGLPVSPYSLWWLEFTFYLLDLLAVPEIYETLMDWSKWKTRPLTGEEEQLARSVYGKSINYKRVRIDESAKIVCRAHHIYYVSFFTINAWKPFRPDIFIHEMMHVWQFQHLGGIYIPHALLAQKTLLGYNYGGLAALEACKKKGGGFADFNMEQQADIVTDYFCLREGLMPNWCPPDAGLAMPVFGYFIEELRDGFLR
ncbi:MAG TPA: hypothetical protein ENJ95_00935 [Bacteroidetes bacterium]|nr:hypothetical protein [Bacteroidota bacterium]